MELLGTIVLFLAGFFILLKGSEYLIKGASSLARLFNISNWVVGVVIVGIGTSIPELSINIASIFQDTDVGLSAIIGSNIFNLLFILGLVAIISPISVHKSWLEKDFVANFLAILFSALFLIFPVFGGEFLGITRLEGLVLFGVFLGWLWFMVRRRRDDAEEKTEYKTFAILTSLFLVGAGIIGVFFGGQWVVQGAEFIALFFGVPQSIVGLTVVALGTSISELTVSIRAALAGSTGLALGNVIGSNIFDFLGILGIASFFGEIPFPPILLFDLVAAILITILLFVVVRYKGRFRIGRVQGFCFILLYFAYFLFTLARA